MPSNLLVACFSAVVLAEVLPLNANIPQSTNPAYDLTYVRLWQPQLTILQGCFPVSPVSEDGELYTRDEMERECQNPDAGSVFINSVRAPRGRALVYSYYFVHDRITKDSQFFPNSWQNVILWMHDNGVDPLQIYAISYNQNYVGVLNVFKHVKLPKSMLWREFVLSPYALVAKDFGHLREGSTSDSDAFPRPYVAPVLWPALSEEVKKALVNANFGAKGSQKCIFCDEEALIETIMINWEEVNEAE